MVLGSFVADDGFTITAGAGALAKKAHGIRANTAGSITFTTVGGTTLTMDVGAGEWIPFICTHVTAATAGGLIGARA